MFYLCLRYLSFVFFILFVFCTIIRNVLSIQYLLYAVVRPPAPPADVGRRHKQKSGRRDRQRTTDGKYIRIYGAFAFVWGLHPIPGHKGLNHLVGNPMGTPWGPHGDPMGYAWGLQNPMGTPWGPHGIPMGPHADPMGSPRGTHGIPMGIPW